MSSSVSGQRSIHSQPHLHHNQQHHRDHHSDYMSVGSHYSRGSVASSQQSSVVDEAYRRLGLRLSMRAHGDGPMKQPQRLAKIGLTPVSGFARYSTSDNAHEEDGTESVTSQDVSRTEAGFL